ncbi:MAG: NifB/NifX family molybdenum-iron cluster-binding protein [Desulfovibrio sp.]|nr:NifB/NifX family molybdenum-iron cluster-binding protein [Desulfovibrio sp.]
MSSTLLAIPSNMPGGLDAEPSQHFGHCEIFTLVTIENNAISKVETLDPIPHTEGGCMAAVQHLRSHNVTALLSGGMGMRPLQGFNEFGINVYHLAGTATVGDAVKAFMEGKLPLFSMDNTCRH